jgi:hypothetical protein
MELERPTTAKLSDQLRNPRSCTGLLGLLLRSPERTRPKWLRRVYHPPGGFKT